MRIANTMSIFLFSVTSTMKILSSMIVRSKNLGKTSVYYVWNHQFYLWFEANKKTYRIISQTRVLKKRTQTVHRKTIP